jgi:hypothetical protein
MRLAAPILAAAIALTGAPALAQPATADQADARCLMVLQFIAQDPKQQDQAAKGMLYYLGRLSSRGPVARVEAIMKAEAPKMAAQQAQAELARCSGELNTRTKEYQAVAQRLAAAARAAAPATPAAPAKK